MGLDISAISEMEPISIPEGIEKWSDEFYEWENKLMKGDLWTPYKDPNFPSQGEGLPDSDLVSAEGEGYTFRGGSYSGYNEWRNDLALASMNMTVRNVWDKVAEGAVGLPFQELLNFADNEGVIGPMASERLYQDFLKYEKVIMEIVDHWYLKMDPNKEYDADSTRWFLEKYNDWKKAFSIARNNGMVIFH